MKLTLKQHIEECKGKLLKYNKGILIADDGRTLTAADQILCYVNCIQVSPNNFQKFVDAFPEYLTVIFLGETRAENYNVKLYVYKIEDLISKEKWSTGIAYTNSMKRFFGNDMHDTEALEYLKDPNYKKDWNR